MLRKFLVITLLLSTSSCAYVDFNKKIVPQIPKSLEGAAKADVKEFFDGDIDAFSIRFNSDNEIIASRVIKINGSWEEGKGIIRQQFISNMSKKDSRTWLITLKNENDFTAIGHDILAPAKGLQTGNVIQMLYTITDSQENSASNVDHEDLMYMIDDNSMIIISKMSKGGKYIGQEIISLSKSNINKIKPEKKVSVKEKKIFIVPDHQAK